MRKWIIIVILAMLPTLFGFMDAASAREQVTLAQKKLIGVTSAGGLQMKEATLFESVESYYLYVLPDYEATLEEPHRDVLFSKQDSRYMVIIQNLAPEADTQRLTSEAVRELNLLGTSRPLANLNRLPAGQVWFANEVASTEVRKSILVLKQGDHLYKITLIAPMGKEAQELTDPLWAMLGTLGLKN